MVKTCPFTIFPKPGHLTFGIPSAVSFDQPDYLLPCPFCLQSTVPIPDIQRFAEPEDPYSDADP